ncbi:hypothetical protein [Acinetobacter sp.]|uniref:hypothetical protein n=1 Tax=Acinetobacter sp. TaxID=472 RepID=UPI000C0A8AA8|nr:hypothetical protein [Acinetobacter sp.]MAK29812.1 hypothetical protein [Acinetobacter sp.]|tara:strand:- start:169 stop:585 length:417 start_codon:yes stop_codon:yes gene_type:complete
MAIKTSAKVYETMDYNNTGQKVRAATVYSFASCAQNDFTSPITLDKAKSVWVTLASTEAAEFYIPAYSGGAIVASETTNYTKMSSSFILNAEDAGVGFGVIVPSANGAGCISGDLMPPALSVKVTGSTTTTVIIHVMY